MFEAFKFIRDIVGAGGNSAEVASNSRRISNLEQQPRNQPVSNHRETKMKQSTGVNVNIVFKAQRPATQAHMVKGPNYNQQRQYSQNCNPQRQDSQNYNPQRQNSQNYNNRGTKPFNHDARSYINGGQPATNYKQNNNPNQGFNRQGNRSFHDGRFDNPGLRNIARRNGDDRVVIIKKKTIIINKTK